MKAPDDHVAVVDHVAVCYYYTLLNVGLLCLCHTQK